jgi:hypothetical protein
MDCPSDQCCASGKDVQPVPQNVQPAGEPFVQQLDIAEHRRLLYAMLLQAIHY